MRKNTLKYINYRSIECQEIIVQKRIELIKYNFSDNIELNNIAEEILKETNDLLGKVQDVDNDNEELLIF
ncbi:9444_t:CDS:2 [Funneliformis geosporum]|uniref:9444_t:CDS:1 n=1 Tax=Funneliformis geosporum TaxID=1117311 RepID=A0A9W4SS61_9GLOM|nr:9444_t:CDS:2 [Funneliformis geosporum]